MSLLSKAARLKKSAGLSLKRNSPAILTAIGVSGTITTAYLAAKASFQAAARLESESPDLSLKEKAEIVWPFYIHTALSGTITVGCIVSAAHINSRRIATAYSVLNLSERAFEEYREKVKETIGDTKEKKIRDQVAQDRVDASPPSEQTLVLSAPGNVMCMEFYTGRYFHSDMESLRKAENEINHQLVRELYVTLDELYDILGLDHTKSSDKVGWEAGRPVEFTFSAVLHNGQPCMVVDYNYVSNL